MYTAFAAYNQLVQYGMGLFGQCPGYGYYGGGGPMGYFWYGGHFMMMLLFILLVVAVYLIARNAHTRKSGGEPTETPLDIIRIRYAKGEITKEQFENLKNDLKV
ncbi:MAG: SHOCT domain-containing protein [Desulfomonilia bacterium]